MFIKKLNIENFKCFAEKTIESIGVPNGEPGSGLNILIGENGNGKTTILEALNYLTLNSYSAENKICINDFNNFKEEIRITAEIDEFKCKSTIDFYNSYYFISNGIEFMARSRRIKERNKLLSSGFETHSYYNIKSKYIDAKGQERSEVDSRDKPYSNSNILGDGLNVFYFDKNRNRQLTTGNYKTTFEKILDDLNWKFVKNLNSDNESEIIQNISGAYFKLIEEITASNAGGKTSKDLAEFFDNADYENLKIDLLDLLAPFKNAFFTLRKDNELKQISIKDLGSGVEIILTILLLKNIANASKGKIIYLIDEPELHLHPKAQEKLLDLLIEESKDKQIFISTHSPYMFKASIGFGANLLLLKKTEENEIEILNARNEGWGLFGDYSPTWGEINWFAYDLPTVEFHNELYGFLQAKAINEDEKNGMESEFDNWLTVKDIVQDKNWIKEANGNPKPPVKRTIQTYIRNSIHHPENKHNENYTTQELRISVNKMIEIINTI